MFGMKKATQAKIESSIEDLLEEKIQLKDSVVELRGKLKEVQQDKKLEEEDIKHMIKMREEAFEVDKQKFELKCEREKDAAIAKVKDDHRDKLEELLHGQIKDGKELYSEILSRLPNVNVRLKGDA